MCSNILIQSRKKKEKEKEGVMVDKKHQRQMERKNNAEKKKRKVGKADTALSPSSAPPAGWSSLSLMGHQKQLNGKRKKKKKFALTSLNQFNLPGNKLLL